ncbi:HARE-HTH domain-containing protein, partial [Haematococcus lacustris]
LLPKRPLKWQSCGRVGVDLAGLVAGSMAGRKRGASRAEYSDPEDEGRTMLGEGIEPLPGGGGIYKSAAVAVLRQERKLMTTGEITRLALERHIIVGNVKTPDSTMASALYTDVKRKRERSVFTRWAAATQE